MGFKPKAVKVHADDKRAIRDQIGFMDGVHPSLSLFRPFACEVIERLSYCESKLLLATNSFANFCVGFIFKAFNIYWL